MQDNIKKPTAINCGGVNLFYKVLIKVHQRAS